MPPSCDKAYLIIVLAIKIERIRQSLQRGSAFLASKII